MIGHLLTLKQLEALVWVADLGSFRKAAHHLNTTQPNISSRIAGVERTLGVTLMLRDAGSVRLTDKGQEVLTAARAVLREAEHLIEVAARPDLIEDRLRLGVTELVACTWLHDYLRRIKAAYPGLTVELTVDLSRNLDQGLSANRLDLAIQTAPFGSVATGVVELGVFPYVWTCSPTVAQQIPPRPLVADLLPHGILTPARHTQAFVELVEHARALGVPVTGFAPSNALASTVRMAADGMGVALLPRALVRDELRRGALICLDVDWIACPLRFAVRYQAEKAARHITQVARLAAEVVADEREQARVRTH